MRVAAALPNHDLRLAQRVARDLEAIGFDGLVAQENRHNPFLPLAAAALATSTIQLGTAVAMAFPRSPMIMAGEAWDLHAASAGRLFLGLGTQVRAHNERRFGVPWSAPAPRLRDYIGAVRAVWRCWEHQEPLDYRSETYKLDLMTPNFAPEPLGLPLPPVMIGAVGPVMLRLAGEVCDGVRLHPFQTRRYLEACIQAEIAEGLARGGGERSRFEVASTAFIATGPDDASVRKMREHLRYRVAFYGSTRPYWEVLRRHDLLPLGERLLAYSRDQRWPEMASLVPDDVLDLFIVSGTYDDIAGRIEERHGGLVDTIEFPVPFDAPLDLDRLARVVERLHRVPTAFESYRDERIRERSGAPP